MLTDSKKRGAPEGLTDALFFGAGSKNSSAPNIPRPLKIPALNPLGGDKQNLPSSTTAKKPAGNMFSTGIIQAATNGHGGVSSEGSLPPAPSTLAPVVANSRPDWYLLLRAMKEHRNRTDFVYLCLAHPEAEIYNPYDLRVVQHAELKPGQSFLTLSPAGVTFVYGPNDASFTSLDAFEREYHQYQRVTALKFFKMFKLWKHFTMWRRYVKRKKARNATSSISKQLFSLNPIFQRALLHVRFQACRVRDMRLQNLTQGSIHSLYSFIQLQREQREVCRTSLDEFSEDACQTVLVACEDALKALERRLLGGGEEEEGEEAAEGEYGEGEAGEGAGEDLITATLTAKLTATGKIDDAPPPTDFSYAVTAARRSEQRRLLSFVRMVDFIIQESLRDLLHDSMRDFLGVIKLPPAPQILQVLNTQNAETAEGGEAEAVAQPAPVFTAEFVFVPGLFTLTITPTSQRFLEALEEVLQGFLDSLNSVYRLMSRPSILDVTREETGVSHNSPRLMATGSAEAGAGPGATLNSPGAALSSPGAPSTSSRLMGSSFNAGSNSTLKTFTTAVRDDLFQEQASELRRRLLAAFERCHQYGQSFQPFLDLCRENDAIDRYTMKAEVESGTRNLETFERDVLRFRQQLADIKGIPDYMQVGIVQLDLRGMKATMLPYPQKCLDEIHALLPVLGAELYQTFIEDVHNCYSTLSYTPSSVEEFVSWLEFLSATLERRDTFEVRQEDVRAHYEFMDRFEIQVPPLELASFQTMRSDVDQFHETLEVAEASKDGFIAKFSEELDQEEERLLQEAEEVRLGAQHEMIMDEKSAMDEVLAYTGKLRARCQSIRESAKRINHYRVLFNVSEKEHPEFETVWDEVDLKHSLWAGLQSWGDLRVEWDGMRLEDLDMASIEEQVMRYSKLSLKVERSLPRNPVVPRLKEAVMSFKEVLPVLNNLRNKDLKRRHWDKVEEALGPKLEAAVALQKEKDRERELLEREHRIMASTSSHLMSRQGSNVGGNLPGASFVGVPPPIDEENSVTGEEKAGAAGDKAADNHSVVSTLSMGSLLSMNVKDIKEKIVAISTEATQEAALEAMLRKVQEKWLGIEFTILSYKDTKDVFILGGVDEIVAALEDSMMTMGTITSSRFMVGIRAEVEKTESALKLFSETLDEWLECQRQWMYLETIFSAPDIQKSLPMESKTFSAVDRHFKDIMRKTRDRPNALQAGTTPGWLDTLQRCNESLERVQKQLEDYLESKRINFPRFYFLSNDELLEILSQSKNPQAVQPHLNKCFDGIRRLDFGNDDPKSIDIFAMISAEGEKVPLGKNLKARGAVEAWLTSVEQAMVASIRRIAKQGYQDYAETERVEWIRSNVPAQLIIAVSNIYWCAEVEAVLGSLMQTGRPAEGQPSGMDRFLTKNVRQLADMCALVRTDLSSLDRKAFVALITIDVHNRDIVEELARDRVWNLNDFSWQMQLRYYYDEQEDSIIIRQVQAHFVYGYEYLGAQPRLVVTPMTDRCYTTLTGALHLKLGGAPAGPAGTGKTETTKDLGKALGVQCVVFNCGDNLDYKFMGKFFAGLAQCGAWACFDEFNRIDIEVLSVVAQQLLTIQNALRAEAARFMFEGREIRLIPTCGVFITMNPGYAGRTELPDNLKALFRPMAMMIPDYALVAEVMLFSEGFEDAKNLSRKMVKLYKLSSEQLSQQDFYDFGMRALKSVLVMAGSLKRASPDLSEDIILIRAMVDSNVPKFLSEDMRLFNAIVQDLFPGVAIPEQDYGALEKAASAVAIAAGLQAHPPFIEKCIQLYITLNVRFGVMLVGSTGAGKTEIYRMLQAAQTKLQDDRVAGYHKTHSYPLNPKAIKMGELYGEYNLLTNEWTDGLGSTLIRQAVADTTEDRKWVVFDGPVDAVWIENMNTVLDDNCTLCLPNGERIKLNPVTMRMLFEVQDLAVASPATVSRCGMVYVPSDTQGWRPFGRSWVERLARGEVLQDETGITARPLKVSAEICDLFWTLMEKHVDNGLAFVRKTAGREAITSSDLNLVVALTKWIECLIHPNRGFDLSKPMEQLKVGLQNIFGFAYTWAIGGNLNYEFWSDFDDFAKTELEGEYLISGGRSLYDCYLEPVAGMYSIKPWADITPPFVYSPSVPYFNLIVPTLDTTRFSYLLQMALEVEKPVLFTGLSGVGKTAVIQDTLFRLASPAVANRSDALLSPSLAGKIMPIFMNFSAQTTSLASQELIESKLEKKRKTRFGAPPGKRIALFVDDVNMPVKEKYGAQPPIEMLRLLLDLHGLYDRKKLFWKDIEDVTMIASCAPPGGGRQEMTPRFVRHFAMLCMPPPNQDVMQGIFQAIVGKYLDHYFSANPDFKRNLLEPMVRCTIEMYLRLCQELLPTPAKSHYTFNLRDVSKTFQGLLLIRPAQCPDPLAMTRLWIHENMRVFHDRLVNNEDKAFYMKMLYENLRNRFGWAPTYEETFEAQAPILFCDFLRLGASGEDKFYEEMKDWGKMSKLLEDYLDEYNMSTSTAQMRLVFFKDAIQHIARITRVLRLPRGNMLLVGVGGSGKQSLTRFASFISEYRCFSIELKKGYGMNDFREDLKGLYKVAGVEGKAVTFLFTDNHIVNEGFVEDVNNLLNSGEIPGLFPADEKEKVLGDLRAAAQQNPDGFRNMPEGRDALWAYFISRVRDNLHVVLCMSPVGEAFRVRCRQFPSLINCCTINWFPEWPEDALLSVSEKFLCGSAMEDTSPEVSLALSKMCSEIHTSVERAADQFYHELRRRFYTTPKSYLDLISLYLELLRDKRMEIALARDRLLNGLNKLQETNAVVDSMKEELNAMQPLLKERSEAAQVLLVEVRQQQEDAEKIKVYVSQEEAVVKKNTDETQRLKDDAQRDLDEVLPALESAQTALNSLRKEDITEIRSFVKPPPLVQLTMEGVCMLLQEKTEWDAAKKVLTDSNFIKRLLEYDKDNIPDKVLKQIKKLIDDPVFTPDQVAKQSKAAQSMCMWVRAMDTYAKVAKVVEPKRQALRDAEAKLAEMKAELDKKQAELQAVVDKVEALSTQLLNTQNELKSLQEQADLCEKRLLRAGKLTSALGDEAVRWTETAGQLEAKLVQLVGDVFLSAAMISYCGAFTGPYRERLAKSWVARCKELGIPVSDEVSLQDTLASPVEVREWGLMGLPSDTLSIDNGVMVTRGRRWPLLIDPQSQANRWIKSMEAKNGLRCARMTDGNLLRTLENSIRIGNPVLLEDVGETLEAALEPLLQKAIFKQGTRMLIRLGDSDVDYDPGFKLYMTTKLPNPHYLPEVCIKVTVINFTVTMQGLEDQLLGDVVRKERPDLEEQKDRLVLSLSNDKRQLKDLEDKILKLLKESQGNILDDELLINTLNNSKLTSGVIKGRVREAEETEKEINASREEYRVVATRGSILYFVVADLALIDPMYQYSLAYFTQLFNYCIDASDPSDLLNQRLQNLMSFTTFFMYATVCRGLFEAHKPIFSFLIATSILRQAKKIPFDEWNFLLRGPASDNAESQNKHTPDPVWLSNATWHLLQALESSCPRFKGLAQSVTANLPAWKAFATADDPTAATIPAFNADGTASDPFQRLLLIKCLREEKLVFGFTMFVAEELGKEFTEVAPFQLADVFKDSSSSTPIIFILSTGADPTGMLQRFGETKERLAGERLRIISLGQGQGPVAETAIHAAQKAGDWVCLQNCHLAKSWMPRLEKLVEEMQEKPVHPDFRLWLTSMPSAYFPVPVLQTSIKLTLEPPKGLRANLIRTYADFPIDFLDNIAEKPQAWRKLVFACSFFHAVVQERRKFGPLGWNISYQFSSGDLECSLQTLKMFLEEQEVIPWSALSYVTGQINYGGRVTDDNDRRLLLCILEKYYTPSVLEDKYTFTPSGIYRAPPDGPAESYLDYLRALPITEAPEVFGMHENANLSFQKQETKKVIETILALQPRVTVAGGGKTSDEIVAELSAAIQARLPLEMLSREHAPLGHADPFAPLESGHPNSLSTFLLQEADRLNRLVRTMASSLRELQKAIQGLVVMSSDLEAMYTRLLNQQVPEIWERVAYPSLKPLGSWVSDLLRRFVFFDTWIRKGEPASFWLPGMFFPQGFLTAALQNHARKTQIAIDRLQFGFAVTKHMDPEAVEGLTQPEDGVYVHGLFLEGGRWDLAKGQIVRSRHGEMTVPLPMIHFMPVKDYVSNEKEYQCPLYKTSVRAGTLSTTGQSTNYVLALSLPIDPNTTPAMWTLNGTAALCMLDE